MIDWKKKIEEIYNRLLDIYPYKQSGNSDSYSGFNQGWSYCCDVYSQEMENFLDELNPDIELAQITYRFYGMNEGSYGAWESRAIELFEQIERKENELGKEN